ncbi:MAG: 3-deoxy-D-manno-octulosonic acid transferase [Rhodospirillales bacterium]|jgi:3-deoxy-D-manno-octulosonic-acid transferase|nr:3-deoxy-D-manno-octulosonic acid transferase [Rhodospirillales bacterium]
MILPLYRFATTLGGPLIRLYLADRMRRGKEDPARFGERLGVAGRDRPDGPLAWIHGASVGEAISLLPLIERMQHDHPSLRVLLTTGTVTSANLMAKRLGGGAIHQFIPVDRLAYVKAFLDHWKPDLVLWAESDFWPNLVGETSRRGTPMVLLNGRISDRSFARWRRYPGTIKALLGCFALCLGQSKTDAKRLEELSAAGAKYLGNLKYAAPPLPADPGELETLESACAGRRVWVAASTHAGEEQICGQIHGQLKTEITGLLSIIVPRHPHRGSAIAQDLRDTGLQVALRSAGGEIGPDTDVYVADTIGELGIFYSLAEIAFIGKSLVPMGGQNPLEAACLERAVVFGPHMTNFREVSLSLIEAGAADEAPDQATLAETLLRLFRDDTLRRVRGRAGQQFAESEAAVLDRVMTELAPFVAKAVHQEADNEAA